MNRTAAVIVLIVGCLVWEACSPSPTKTNFVMMIGQDTLGVESYTMSPSRLEGTSVIRSPQTTIRDYSASFEPSGALKEFVVTYRSPDGTTLSERKYAYTDDSVHISLKQGDNMRSISTAATGHPYPFFMDIAAGWDAALQHAQGEAGSKQTDLLGGRRVIHCDVQGTAPGRLAITSSDLAPDTLYATVDKDGRLEGLDLTATTDKYVFTRVPTLDILGKQAEFSALDSTGMGMGVLSPRDTARAVIRGAHILIDYGRPSMRGREIFGNVVPWGEVWRTGANAATQLITDRNLRFGKTIVKKGTYSLFTLPSQSGWQLIINKQHGQWGTRYDEKQDLVRLPMKTSMLSTPVEEFTLEVARAGRHGVLRFRWDRLEESIPFEVR